MYDHTVFAVLTPEDSRSWASGAFKLPHNSKWFQKGVGGVAKEPTLRSREATPAGLDPPEEGKDSNTKKSNDGDRLVITLDDVENPANGIQFGSNTVSSHTLLGHRGTPGVSSKQCNITVDNYLRVWLHDYHSSHGTAVSYNGCSPGPRRKKEVWILADWPGCPDKWSVSVWAHKVAFRIEFPNHRHPSPDYIATLQRFLKRRQEASQQPPLLELTLDSGPVTQAPSTSQTPDLRPLFFETEVIGSGSFGRVSKMIKARTAERFAGKTFFSLGNKRGVDKANSKWIEKIRREFDIMAANPHSNLVRVHEFWEAPQPRIVMDYYPEGSLKWAKLSDWQYTTCTGQILEGLVHLHKNGIAHRDLKPDNVLITTRPYFRVAIADFGLAKDTANTVLQTHCGSPRYMAPEITTCDRHQPKVDVWSLGVMTLDWIFGLPPVIPQDSPQANPAKWPKGWAGAVTKRMADLERTSKTDEVYLMLQGMLVEQHRRWDARTCLSFGFEERLFSRRPADDLIVCPDDNQSQVSSVPEIRSRANLAPGPVIQNQYGNLPPKSPLHPGRTIRAP